MAGLRLGASARELLREQSARRKPLRAYLERPIDIVFQVNALEGKVESHKPLQQKKKENLPFVINADESLQELNQRIQKLDVVTKYQLTKEDIQHLQRIYGRHWKDEQKIQYYLQAKNSNNTIAATSNVGTAYVPAINVDRDETLLDQVKTILLKKSRNCHRYLMEVRVVTDLEYFCKELWISIVKKFQQERWKKKLAWAVVNYIRKKITRVPAVVGVVLYNRLDMVQVHIEIKSL